MAAIAGQPSPKPSSLKGPIANKNAQADIDSFVSQYSAPKLVAPNQQAPAQGSSEIDSFISDNTPPAEPRSAFSLSGRGLAQGALNTLPTVLGIAGGIAGGAAGFLSPIPGGTAMGTVGGAGAGGIAGQSLKSALESALFGNNPQSRSEFYKDLGKEGINQAENAMLGEIVPVFQKSFSASGIKKMGSALGIPEEATGTYLNAPKAVKDLAAQTNGDVATASDIKRQGFQDAIKQTKGELEDPILQLMHTKGTTASDREVGDQVKTLIHNDVEAKYGPFQKAYSEIEQVHQAAPISDRARKDFQDSTRSWALEKFPQSSQSWNRVKAYTDSFSASNNGAQFNSVLDALKDEISAAYRTGKTREAQFLSTLEGKAEDFLDNQFEGIARRVSAGKATPEEMLGFERMMVAQKNPNVPASADNLNAYTKSVAKDFLAGKDKIRKDYAGFKSFMSNLEEGTQVSSNGPMSFLRKLDEVPAEKLVSKMFDEKNSAALETMKKETPAVFNAIAQNKVKEIMLESTSKEGLDVAKFHENVMSLSKEVRNVLFEPSELGLINKTLSNPKYQRLNNVLNRIDQKLITPNTNHNALLAAGNTAAENNRGLRDLGELSLLTGTNMVNDTRLLSSMEHYGKTKLNREQMFKLLVNPAGAAIRATPQTPMAKQLTGQAAGAALRGATRGVSTFINGSSPEPVFNPLPAPPQDEE